MRAERDKRKIKGKDEIAYSLLSVGNHEFLIGQVPVERIHWQQNNPWDVQVLDDSLSNTRLSTGTCTLREDDK